MRGAVSTAAEVDSVPLHGVVMVILDNLPALPIACARGEPVVAIPNRRVLAHRHSVHLGVEGSIGKSAQPRHKQDNDDDVDKSTRARDGGMGG